MTHADNIIAFEPKPKEAPTPLQWELRLNRETFDFEVGVVNAAGDVVPLLTWRLASGADDADLDLVGRFCDAWDQMYGTAAAAS